MNRVEALVDDAAPAIGTRLRVLKKRLQRDLTLQIIDRIVQRGDSTVDVGANRGVYTRWLARAVGRSGHVVSIEPYPPNADALRAVWERRRGSGNVTVWAAAASDTTGSAELRLPVMHGRPVHALASIRAARAGDGGRDEAGDGGGDGAGNETVRVPLRTIDDMVGPCSGPVAFMKVDVEGHEDAVLRGSTRILAEHRPALVIEIEQRHRSTPVADVLDQILGYGYDGFFIERNVLRPIEKFDVGRHQHGVLAEWTGVGPAPDGYVNNFVFVQPPSTPRLATLIG